MGLPGNTVGWRPTTQLTHWISCLISLTTTSGEESRNNIYFGGKTKTLISGEVGITSHILHSYFCSTYLAMIEDWMSVNSCTHAQMFSLLDNWTLNFDLKICPPGPGPADAAVK